MGEWTKYPHNPLLQKIENQVGVGHSSMFKDKEGNWKIVFHAHQSDSAIHPRKMFITSIVFRSVNRLDELYIDSNYEVPVFDENNETFGINISSIQINFDLSFVLILRLLQISIVF